MDPVFLANLLSQGGSYAVIAILLGVIAKLWDLNQKLQQARLDDKDKQLSDAQTTFSTVTSALDTVKATIQAFQTLGRQ